MNRLYDTNIILAIIRSNDNNILSFLNPKGVKIYISVATEAEIKSIALRSKWGALRLAKLDAFLDRVNIMEITQHYINTYIEIDTYSQCSNPEFTDYPFKSPRNMGKNDLWIAALAALLGLKLVTTDGDFDHLNKIFFEIDKINSEDFIKFF
ncbi:PIN domain-containing protein [Pedobacter sp. MC2016-14]|uniref:PIN domain-containing protein n=1 Tax=Pedobacter sp. MC2016-14 TaxID=2897327 RepID=UPI001E593432|nr:PIN domain-containing protein [Pedobacter sp. MC2016-14]MCD0489655.1 PIN domain-containing protein [Pedobacter sp. MC2016-14]